jgi:hypothetical protein
MRLERAPYLVAVLTWGLAFAGTTLLWPILDPNPFLLFILSVTVSAWAEAWARACWRPSSAPSR